MEKNERFKMHKVKKRWVTFSVASATMLASAIGASAVQADEVAATTDGATSQAVVSGDQTTATQETTEVAATATSEQPATTEQVVTEQVVETPAAEQGQATTNANQAQWVAVPNETARVATTSQTEVPQALTSLSNVKEIDGKYYYLDENGNPMKNFAIAQGGQLFYFDETGAYKNTAATTAASSTGIQTSVSEFVSNNRAYDATAKSFEAIDGYLTADSWYRPAYILKDGVTWVASTDADFRPMLMAWWPDTDTKVNYVNYMNKALGIDTTVSTSTSAADLQKAAETVQARIEQRIVTEQNTNWLRQAISAFVKTQSQWNGDSEKPYDDHLQNGALRYDNDAPLTPNTESDYRLLNRTPSAQTGTLDSRYTYNPSDPLGGYEYLLANDVDNSNPVVQAESLNWLHYLMNFGSIVANDPDANFDSIRVDAVDNVDADLLQIASDYLKAAYGIDENNKKANDHISIVEAWSNNDTPYLQDDGDNLMNMDNKNRLSLLWSLAKPLVNSKGEKVRSGMNPLMTNSVVNREIVDTEEVATPNYTFARAHDSEVQDLIRDIIKAEINPNSFGYSFTQEEIDQAFKIYNEDLKKTDKVYTHYNVPLSYTLLLTNKGTIPRIYYGDMYTDDGQYMAEKTPNFDAIQALLKSRIKYVSGGQAMQNYLIGKSNSGTVDPGMGEILTSVRYGKGALKQSDTGTEETRTSGIGIVMSNQPDFDLDGKVIALNMGAAHRNQEYRALMVSTETGVAIYNTDEEARAAGMIKTTNDEGYLYFLDNDVKGVANPQVSGFLTVWVPVGASEDQDIRVEASDAASTDGKSLHQDAALDSHVMFEGFSNFQAFAKTPDQYANRIIAENADLFASWGITDFEMAPQYTSSDDGQFLDSVIQNGYAFTDRYDLGMSKANKYGTSEDLVKAIKALHKAGMRVMADWIPDQMYTMPEKEVVTVTRTDKFGRETEGSPIKGSLYVTDTKGSGSDYQAKYGGEFLEELQAKYPEIFDRIQISTGQKIDPSEKIKVWSAKYFNGSNILGRGSDYVLNDQATKEYFSVADGKTFLPAAMMGEAIESGIEFDGKGYIFKSTSTGQQVKNSFINQGNNLYYFGNDGYMVTGEQSINGANYYFLDNGVALRNTIYTDDSGKAHYYGNDGRRYENGHYQFGQVWRFFHNGVMAQGATDVYGYTQFFKENGEQVKGAFATDKDGKTYFLDKNSGNALTNSFAKDDEGNWYYFGKDGAAVTGQQEINGDVLYFEDNGHQIKGQFHKGQDGKLHYYDADSGAMWTERFVQDTDGHWYYLDAKGNPVTGAQTINGQRLFFNADGTQVKGAFHVENGKTRYYDPDSGDMWVNRFIQNDKGQWLYLGADGVPVTGQQTINGQRLYFNADGTQVKGGLVRGWDGQMRYYDAQSGEQVYNRVVQANGRTYYVLSNGIAVTQEQYFFGNW